MPERTRGRGEEAVTDMKARIASLKADGFDAGQILAVLWDRCTAAEQGAGYEYEFAATQPVRSDGQLRQPAGR
jgi:hypothetical protein